MDFYQLLELERTASDDDIKKAYRKLAMKYHPDRNKDDTETAEKKFKQIKEAYETLSDPAKRASYNIRSAKPKQNYSSAFRDDVDFENFADIFGQAFRNAQYRQAKPQKNSTVTINISVTLAEIFNGKTLIGNLKLPSGREQPIELQIPPGVSHGEQIKYANLGDDTISAIPRGDLIVNINEIPDKTFERINADLLMEYTISVFDAILGTTIDIKGIDGKLIKVTVPVSTQYGDVITVPNQGLPEKYMPGERGHIFVRIIIKIPIITDTIDKTLIQQIQNRYHI
jgi:DnaJ-class molecular chaperone